MNVMNKDVVVTRPYKVVYREGDQIIKVFTPEHGKANVFNEALCQARVEESGLNIPKVLEVTQIDGEWALKIEYVEGKTMEEIMENDPVNMEKYMEQFVDLQLTMHAKKAPRLTLQKDKFARKIETLKETVDATTRYELQTRLDSMPKHTKLCHGDFNPTNIIITDDGTPYILDWSHATQGNASADVARTYLLFWLNGDIDGAKKYLDMFCERSNTAKQYVQKWMPIVAASQTVKGNEAEREFLHSWIDVVDYE